MSPDHTLFSFIDCTSHAVRGVTQQLNHVFLIIMFKLTKRTQPRVWSVALHKAAIKEKDTPAQKLTFFLLASLELTPGKVKETDYLVSKRVQLNSTEGHEWSWETRETRFPGYAASQL